MNNLSYVLPDCSYTDKISSCTIKRTDIKRMFKSQLVNESDLSLYDNPLLESYSQYFIGMECKD
jgi:hypothetical protein